VLRRRYREIEQALKSAKRKHCASLYSDNFGWSAATENGCRTNV